MFLEELGTVSNRMVILGGSIRYSVEESIGLSKETFKVSWYSSYFAMLKINDKSEVVNKSILQKIGYLNGMWTL